jgi:hypothetical protein
MFSTLCLQCRPKLMVQIHDSWIWVVIIYSHNPKLLCHITRKINNQMQTLQIILRIPSLIHCCDPQNKVSLCDSSTGITLLYDTWWTKFTTLTVDSQTYKLTWCQRICLRNWSISHTYSLKPTRRAGGAKQHEWWEGGGTKQDPPDQGERSSKERRQNTPNLSMQLCAECTCTHATLESGFFLWVVTRICILTEE